MKIKSHQTEPEKRNISTKNVDWYWRVPYIYMGKVEQQQNHRNATDRAHQDAQQTTQCFPCFKHLLPPHALGLWLSHQKTYQPIKPGLIKQIGENAPVLKNVGEDAGDNEMATKQTKRYHLQHLHHLHLSDICARVFSVKRICRRRLF